MVVAAVLVMMMSSREVAGSLENSGGRGDIVHGLPTDVPACFFRLCIHDSLLRGLTMGYGSPETALIATAVGRHQSKKDNTPA